MYIGCPERKFLEDFMEYGIFVIWMFLYKEIGLGSFVVVVVVEIQVMGGCYSPS